MSQRNRAACVLILFALALGAGGCAEVRVTIPPEAMSAWQPNNGGLAYDLPAGAIVALTNAEPGRDTGLRVRFNMTAGQLETFTAVITVPAAFTFNGFDALGPANTVIGHYGFDFTPGPNGDGVPDVVLRLRSIDRDTAYVDGSFNGTFQANFEPIVTHAEDASGNHVFTAVIPLGGDGLAATTTAQFSAGIVASLATGVLRNPAEPGTYTLSALFTSVDPDTDGADDGTGEPPRQIPTDQEVTIAPGTLFTALLPSGRAVVFNTPATAFVSMINAGPAALTGCAIQLITALRAQLLYQTTDPATNTLVGSPNTPADIAPGQVGTFLVAVTPQPDFVAGQPVPPTTVEFLFSCDGGAAAPVLPGTNTLLLSAATAPVPDVIAIAATLTGDGIAIVPGPGGVGVFGVSGVNIGAGATITVRPVARPGVPVTLSVCDTTGSPGGACLAPPGPTVVADFPPNAVRTFSVFVAGTGTPIPVDLAASRATVQFEEADGTVRGATNVAVQTGPP